MKSKFHRTSEAGSYVLDVADSAKEMPRRTSMDWMACAMSPCKVSDLSLLALPDTSFSNSSGGKCWSTAPNTFHACKAALMEKLIGPNEKNACLIVQKLHVNSGHSAAT